MKMDVSPSHHRVVQMDRVDKDGQVSAVLRVANFRISKRQERGVYIKQREVFMADDTCRDEQKWGVEVEVSYCRCSGLYISSWLVGYYWRMHKAQESLAREKKKKTTTY